MEDSIHRDIVVITTDKIYSGESFVIEHITKRGAFVHLRKPGSSTKELEDYCHSLSGNRELMTLHYNHSLAIEESLGGSHLRLRDIASHSNYSGRISTSCHTIEEAKIAERSAASYYFISPIFDSISKQGYRSAFSNDQINYINTHCPRATALGGVNLDNISQLAGFNSIALLGAVWVIENRTINIDRSIENFDKIYNLWNQL